MTPMANCGVLQINTMASHHRGQTLFVIIKRGSYRSNRSHRSQNPSRSHDLFTTQDTNHDRFAPLDTNTDPGSPQAIGLRLLESGFGLGRLGLDHFQPNSGIKCSESIKVSSRKNSRTFPQSLSAKSEQSGRPAKPCRPAGPAQMNQPPQGDVPAEIKIKTSKTRFQKERSLPKSGFFRKKELTKTHNRLVNSAHITHWSVSRRMHSHESLLLVSGIFISKLPYYQRNYLVKSHQGDFYSHGGYQKVKNNNRYHFGTFEEKLSPKFNPKLKTSHGPRVFKVQFKKLVKSLHRPQLDPVSSQKMPNFGKVRQFKKSRAAFKIRESSDSEDSGAHKRSFQRHIQQKVDMEANKRVEKVPGDPRGYQSMELTKISSPKKFLEAFNRHLTGKTNNLVKSFQNLRKIDSACKKSLLKCKTEVLLVPITIFEDYFGPKPPKLIQRKMGFILQNDKTTKEEDVRNLKVIPQTRTQLTIIYKIFNTILIENSRFKTCNQMPLLIIFYSKKFSGCSHSANADGNDHVAKDVEAEDMSQISSTPLPEDTPDLRMSIFHNEMEAAAKLSYGSAPADPKIRARTQSPPEDKEDLRITINNNRMASNEARLAPRYSSTISGALSEWSECREGSFCRHFNTEKCQCFEEKRPASVIHDGHWQPEEPTEAESEAASPNINDGGNTLKIASVFHNCQECGATHKVPQYPIKREAALEAAQNNEVDEAKSEISLGSTLEEVLLHDTMLVDPDEVNKAEALQAYPEVEDEAVAMADPLDIVEFFPENPKQVMPEIEILEEVINLIDSSDEENDHLPDTEDEEEALAYGRQIWETLYYPGGIHHLHVVYPVPQVPTRREI